MSKIQDFRDQFEAAEKRYKDRTTARKKRLKALDDLGKGGQLKSVDELPRIQFRMESLGLDYLTIERLIDTSAPAEPNHPNLLERIISQNNLKGIAFLHRGIIASQAVSRVLVSERGRIKAFGTGFMISPRLFMTNNHVIENASTASESEAEFDYFKTITGEDSKPKRFRFDPRTFFKTDQHLDVTIVAVEEENAKGTKIASRGWLPTIPDSGKVIVGERGNIIQHPNGGPQQVAIRQNRVIDVFDDYLHYTTDTLQGSSGSALCNDSWEVGALHHAGVPKKDTKGNVLLIDGTVWNGHESTRHLIAWIANEGIRISRIVDWLSREKLTKKEQALATQAQKPPTYAETSWQIPFDDLVPGGLPTIDPIDEAEEKTKPNLPRDFSVVAEQRVRVSFDGVEYGDPTTNRPQSGGGQSPTPNGPRQP